MKRIEGKSAVIFGATSGIGKSTAIRFGAEGACVTVCGRNEERGNAVVSEIKNNGGEAIFVRVDALIEDDVKAALQAAVDTYGKIDVLVNVTGNNWVKPLEEMTSDDWDLHMNTNLRSAFYSTKYAMPELLKTKGNIVNVASQGGIKPIGMDYAYCASKAGLNMFTKVVALDYADKGVRANSVCPGVIDTPLLDSTPQEVVDAVADSIPLKRIGQPEEVANMVLFLASDEASNVTGALFSVDGGGSL